MSKVTLWLGVDTKKPYPEYVLLGEVDTLGMKMNLDEITLNFTVKVGDIRVWEVAIATGKFWTIRDMESLYPGPIGGWGKPPYLTIKLEIDEQDLVYDLPTLLFSDFICTSGVPWPLENNQLVDLEFSKYLP